MVRGGRRSLSICWKSHRHICWKSPNHTWESQILTGSFHSSFVSIVLTLNDDFLLISGVGYQSVGQSRCTSVQAGTGCPCSGADLHLKDGWHPWRRCACYRAWQARKTDGGSRNHVTIWGKQLYSIWDKHNIQKLLTSLTSPLSGVWAADLLKV